MNEKKPMFAEPGDAPFDKHDYAALADFLTEARDSIRRTKSNREMYDRCIAAMRACVPCHPQRFCWLIESNRIAGVPMYATCGAPKWTTDPHQAAQFPTQSAAETAKAMCLLYNTDEGGSEDARAVEHGFSYLPSAEGSSAAIIERTAQIAAHRACCGTEHDAANGKLHGYCVVCGVPWPCDYAGKPPVMPSHEGNTDASSADAIDTALALARMALTASPNSLPWYLRNIEENLVVALRSMPSATRDTERLDWLEGMVVKVSAPLVYGSRELFIANPEAVESLDDLPSDLRKQIDAQIRAAVDSLGKAERGSKDVG